MPALSLQRVRKRLGLTASGSFCLHIPELTIKEGEFFALVGPSGCGKTTLLQVVAGLLSPDEGEVRWGAERINETPPEKRNFAMVFQHPLLFPHMTVEENVAFGLKMKHIPRKRRRDAAREWLAAVGLAGMESKRPSMLSGGQQQRVSLARALAVQPRLLLLDEPFSALDPGLREEMRDLVANLHRDHRMTVLFVTHDREEASQLADRIGVMKDGRLLQTGTPLQLYENPNGPEVARFLGVKNIVAGTLEAGGFRSGDLHIPLSATPVEEETGWLLLRPDMLEVVPLKGKKENEREKCWEAMGSVREASFRFGFTHIRVECGSHVFEVIAGGGRYPRNLLRGDRVLIRCPLAAMKWIPAKGDGVGSEDDVGYTRTALGAAAH
jgi:ABC-type Fe3+/spermidine/putrescine transport system ATPase subunit